MKVKEICHYKMMHNSEGKEWVVFIHGIGGGSSIWYKQLRDYRKYYNLLLIDLPGHGSSPYGLVDMKEPTVQSIAKEVLKILEHNQINNAHFVGLSLGTFIIQVFQELYPDKVTSMILGGAVDKFNALVKCALCIVNHIKNILPYMLIYKLSAWLLMPYNRHKESRMAFIKEAHKLGRNEFFQWFEIHPQIEKFFAKRINRVQIPTLYLMGNEDYVFLPSIRQRHNQNACELQIIHQAGHVVNIDNSHEFNFHSLKFLHSISTVPVSAS